MKKIKAEEYKELFKKKDPFVGKILHSHYQYVSENAQSVFDLFFTDDKAWIYDDGKGFVCCSGTDMANGKAFVHITMNRSHKNRIDIEIYALSYMEMGCENPLIRILRNKMEAIHNRCIEGLILQICCEKRYEWQKNCDRELCNEERCRWNYFKIKDRDFTNFREVCYDCPEETLLSDILYLDLL